MIITVLIENACALYIENQVSMQVVPAYEKEALSLKFNASSAVSPYRLGNGSISFPIEPCHYSPFYFLDIIQ